MEIPYPVIGLLRDHLKTVAVPVPLLDLISLLLLDKSPAFLQIVASFFDL